jgi:hypothetical protein
MKMDGMGTCPYIHYPTLRFRGLFETCPAGRELLLCLLQCLKSERHLTAVLDQCFAASFFRFVSLCCSMFPVLPTSKMG